MIEDRLLHLLNLASQIIPITDAMREPKKFPRVLTWVMIFLTCEFL